MSTKPVTMTTLAVRKGAAAKVSASPGTAKARPATPKRAMEIASTMKRSVGRTRQITTATGVMMPA